MPALQIASRVAGHHVHSYWRWDKQSIAHNTLEWIIGWDKSQIWKKYQCIGGMVAATRNRWKLDENGLINPPFGESNVDFNDLFVWCSPEANQIQDCTRSSIYRISQLAIFDQRRVYVFILNYIYILYVIYYIYVILYIYILYLLLKHYFLLYIYI